MSSPAKNVNNLKNYDRPFSKNKRSSLIRRSTVAVKKCDFYFKTYRNFEGCFSKEYELSFLDFQMPAISLVSYLVLNIFENDKQHLIISTSSFVINFQRKNFFIAKKNLSS